MTLSKVIWQHIRKKNLNKISSNKNGKKGMKDIELEYGYFLRIPLQKKKRNGAAAGMVGSIK